MKKQRCRTLMLLSFLPLGAYVIDTTYLSFRNHTVPPWAYFLIACALLWLVSSLVLLALFACTLGLWSKRSRFKTMWRIVFAVAISSTAGLATGVLSLPFYADANWFTGANLNDPVGLLLCSLAGILGFLVSRPLLVRSPTSRVTIAT